MSVLNGSRMGKAFSQMLSMHDSIRLKMRRHNSLWSINRSQTHDLINRTMPPAAVHSLQRQHRQRDVSKNSIAYSSLAILLHCKTSLLFKDYETHIIALLGHNWLESLSALPLCRDIRQYRNLLICFCFPLNRLAVNHYFSMKYLLLDTFR